MVCPSEEEEKAGGKVSNALITATATSHGQKFFYIQRNRLLHGSGVL